MDVMRKAIYMLSVLCVAALWGGCQRGGGEETAQVTLRFNTRASSSIVDEDENAKEGEGMKSLQLVLYRQSGSGYEFYRVYSWDETELAGTDGIFVTELEGGIDLGNYMFYAVANGASAGLTVEEEGMTETALRGHIMRNGAFPAVAVPAAGLPMAGFKQVIVNQERVTERIEVVRAVARLDIELENATGSDMTVQSINLGAFVADQAYLFGQGNEAMPEGTAYSTKAWEVSGRIADGEKGTYSYYLYPSAAGADAYKLGLTTNVKTYDPQPLMEGSTYLSRMPRNTVYKIQAIVDVDAITFRGITVDGWETSYSGGDINIGNND